MSFVILVIDRDYVAGEMLPTLAAQHFSGAEEGIDYEMAVVSPGAKVPVYSTTAAFMPDPAGSSDAAADLFQVRQQEFGTMVSEVRRFSTFLTTRIERQRAEPNAVEGRVAVREAPFSIMVQRAEGSRPGIERGVATAAALAARQAAPPWRLIVKHPSGSLEAAVAQVRRRNLLVSSGILGILGISVGFLMLTTRRAQGLARQQMEFVAAVSHELRTPLAVIRSAADNLAEGVVHGDDQVRKYGALVRGEGRRLSEMVEQILELAGIHSGQRGFALAPVAVPSLLREVVGASATLIEDANLRVDYDLPDGLPPVLGDEQALRRLVQNLLGNAIKYGESGGWIGIRARSSGREVTISVEDRGMGIEPEEQERIFEPFYRAPGAIAAQIQGAGLGLSLVQRIVEAHGGRITVRSAPGSGSEFTVHLPSASGEGVDSHATQNDERRTTNATFIVRSS
jgi:signal transduction histidine kinase